DRELSRRQLRARDRGRERVENHVLGLLDDRVGQGMARRLGHVGRQGRHQRADGSLCLRPGETGGKKRCGHGAAGGLEKFASLHLCSFFASGSWGSVPLAGFSSPVFEYVASFSRVSVMSRFRIVSWPMRSCGVKNASPFSIVSRSGLYVRFGLSVLTIE